MRLKLADVNYLLILQNPVAWLCGKWMEAHPEHAWTVSVPEWVYPFSGGIALATLFYDLIRPGDSRIWQICRRLTDKFRVEHAHAGHWSTWDAATDPMPETDVGLRLRLRFVRSGKFKLRVRLFSCTGRGAEPFQHLIPLGEIDATNGQIFDLPLVDMGLQEAGWDHTRKRGWGPDREHSLIGKSFNVAIVECEGKWLTQKHRFFVAHINHDTGLHRHKPSIYFQDESDDVWDVSGNNRMGIFK